MKKNSRIYAISRNFCTFHFSSIIVWFKIKRKVCDFYWGPEPIHRLRITMENLHLPSPRREITISVKKCYCTHFNVRKPCSNTSITIGIWITTTVPRTSPTMRLLMIIHDRTASGLRTRFLPMTSSVPHICPSSIPRTIIIVPVKTTLLPIPQIGQDQRQAITEAILQDRIELCRHHLLRPTKSLPYFRVQILLHIWLEAWKKAPNSPCRYLPLPIIRYQLMFIIWDLPPLHQGSLRVKVRNITTRGRHRQIVARGQTRRSVRTIREKCIIQYIYTLVPNLAEAQTPHHQRCKVLQKSRLQRISCKLEWWTDNQQKV